MLIMIAFLGEQVRPRSCSKMGKAGEGADLGVLGGVGKVGW